MLMVRNSMKLLLNDPATPNLVIDTKVVRKPKVCPPFVVRGYEGGARKMGTDIWRAAQTYCVILNTLHTMQSAFIKPVSRWPRTRSLTIMPKAGMDLNAYYDGRSLRFFHAADPVSRKMVHTAESVDIVAHEMGHALLDAIRPDLWNLQALEVWSFHEAWSDMVAVLTVLRYETVMKHILEETGGDLMKSNVVTRLAEEMGTTIYRYSKGKGGRRPGALRHANNNFAYRPPEKLPRNAPHNKLARECHSFGRVFLGAYYEVFAKMYQFEREDGHSPIDAMKRTRSVTAKLLARSAKLAPATPRFYDAVARTMIRLDEKWGGRYNSILKGVFNRRKILSRRSVKALTTVKLNDIDLDNNVVEECNDGSKIVRVQSLKKTTLDSHYGVRAQANNPLYACEIEIPNESYLEFDKNGNLVESIATSERVAIDSARECIRYLHDEDMVKDGEAKEGDFTRQFSVVDSKLVRNFFI